MKLFDNPSLVELNSPEFDQLSEIEGHIEKEEVIEIMGETMEQYMSKTQEDYGSGVTRPTINQDTPLELKGHPRNGLNTPRIGTMERLPRTRSIGPLLTGFAAIKPNRHLRREIRNVNEKESIRCSGPDANYATGTTLYNGLPTKEEGKTLEEAYYTYLVHLINLEDNTEQQDQDSTNAIMEILHTLLEEILWKNHCPNLWPNQPRGTKRTRTSSKRYELLPMQQFKIKEHRLKPWNYKPEK
ncbi:hypothetical protein Tco_1194961 [Tanacetum coccineum]